jgi:hypothetical protein
MLSSEPVIRPNQEEQAHVVNADHPNALNADELSTQPHSGTKPMLQRKEFVYEAKVAGIHKARVNVKSLAAEARLNRQESARCGPEYRDCLAVHRRGRLRSEARYAQLALAFLRGRAYRSVEAKLVRAEKVDGARLTKKIAGFWYKVTANDVKEWLER